MDKKWVKVYGHANRGIPGGWSVSVIIDGILRDVNAVSPEDAYSKLSRLYRKTGVQKSDEEIKDELNALWCSKAPDRCKGSAPTTATVRTVKQNVSGCKTCGGGIRQVNVVGIAANSNSKVAASSPFRKIFGPGDWGPIIWKTLHLFGVVFSRSAFMSYISYMKDLMNPDKSVTGCAECFGHFIDYLHRNPVDSITTNGQCADWVFNFHNSVNTRIGKPGYTREQMREEYGV